MQADKDIGAIGWEGDGGALRGLVHCFRRERHEGSMRTMQKEAGEEEQR